MDLIDLANLGSVAAQWEIERLTSARKFQVTISATGAAAARSAVASMMNSVRTINDRLNLITRPRAEAWKVTFY